MDTINVVQLYANYAGTHIYYGMEVAVLSLSFQFFSALPFASLILSLWSCWLCTVALTLAPWWFNPGALTLNSVLEQWLKWQVWMEGFGEDSMPGKGDYAAWHKGRMAPLRTAKWSLKLWIIASSALLRSVLLLGCVAGLRVAPELLGSPPSVALGVILQATALLWFCMLVYQALLVGGGLAIRSMTRSRVWPLLWTVALLVALSIFFSAVLEPTLLGLALPADCGCGESLCRVCPADGASHGLATPLVLCQDDAGVAYQLYTSWCGTAARYVVGQPKALALLFVGAFLILSCAVQLLGHMRDVDAPKDGKGRPPLKAVWAGVVYVLRGWSDFWHKQKDQAIGGTIFLCLTVLSFLPLTWLQTSTLYNAKFAANLRWRARREMFLDNLMA